MSSEISANLKYNYADYLTWPENERWEIIEGVVWDMSPAPNTEHQSISMFLSGEIYSFLKGKSCKVFTAPFDVRLKGYDDSSDDQIETVVQPDLSVVCDPEKLDKMGCLGAPDLVIEILSPSTAFKDESQKLKLYEKHGVTEYWIVNPEAQYIMIYRLSGQKFNKPEYLKEDDIASSVVLKGLKINLSDIFQR